MFSVAVAATDIQRREFIASGGLIGLLAMIGLILYPRSGGSVTPMTVRQPFALDGAIGCLITWGGVPLTASLGVNDQIGGLNAILWMCATASMVGVIGARYVRKRESEGKAARSSIPRRGAGWRLKP